MSVKQSILKWQAHFAVDGQITCWTMLERTTWKLIEAAGTLNCPIAKADDDPMFQAAYEWMKTCMIEAGLQPPAPNLSPWWCWVRRDPDNPEPYAEDLHGFSDPVVLQMSVPASQLALSCFDLWHFVLNRSYVYASEEDELEFDRALAAAEKGSTAEALLEARLRASWPAVFDLDQTNVDMGTLASKSIQGCFWTLNRSYVTAVLEKSALNSFEWPSAAVDA